MQNQNTTTKAPGKSGDAKNYASNRNPLHHLVSSCFRVRFYPVSLREAGVITGESFCSENQKKRRRKAPFEFPALARKGVI